MAEPKDNHLPLLGEHGNLIDTRTGLIDKIDQLNINDHFKYTYNQTERKHYEFDQDIDPEDNFYSQIELATQCEYYTDEQFKHLHKNDNFSLIHFNGRSLNKNFDSINEYLSQFNTFSVIAVSEAWLNNEQKIQNVEMDGYNLFTSNRQFKTGGGVALYVDSNLKCKLIESKTVNIADIIQCITVELVLENSKNIVISNVYRKPNSSLELFNSTIDNIFSNLENNKVHIACGDFNLNLLNPHNETHITDFIDSMYSYSLFPIITKPTRIKPKTATLIDHIYLNTFEHPVTAGILINDTTDHLPIFSIFHQLLNKEPKPQSNTHTLTRHNTPEAIMSLKEDLKRQTWADVLNTSDPNTSYNNFLTIFTELYDKHCPIKLSPIKRKKTQDKPWITKGIANACKKKNTLYRIFINKRTIETESRYKTYKNKLTNIIRTSKRDYYHNQLEQHKGNTKATWKVLNNIIKKNTAKREYPCHFTKDNVEIKNTSDIANEFNQFFVNVGPSLANQIIEPSNHHGLDYTNINHNPHSFFLTPVNEKEILDIVNNCKNKKSTDSNDLDMALIKCTINEIVMPFTYICNLSFKNGLFPNAMKTAKVIPVYKSGDKHLFTNYRPISLLSQFSKLLEKLFVVRLDSFIEKHNILSDHQYGFRSNRSTAMAVTDLVEAIATGTNNKEYTVGVFIDLKKAFDTIDLNILAKKLERYGFRGVTLSWLESYLHDRKQYVQINGIASTTLHTTHGVPQGSVLGPKLFILYINDVCNILPTLNCVLFADDTSLHSSGKNLNQLILNIEHELEILKTWFDINKLSLNISKTNYMIFGNRQIPEQIKLKINNTEINQVKHTKFLGITIDHALDWKEHVKNTKAKISKTIAILYKVKDVVNSKSLLTLYHSLIFPYINYCIEIWGNTYKETTKPIVTIQKKAIRIINKTYYTAHTPPLFIKNNLLKFIDLVDYNTAIFTYKAHKNGLPPCLQKLFVIRETKYNLRGTNKFNKHFARINDKAFCLSVKGINLWNDLDNELKSCTSLNKFKKMYKNKIINRYKAEA